MKRSQYLPPAYLLDKVELTFELFDGHTVVRSRLNLRRNPQPGSPRELILDGDGLETYELKLDGRVLGVADYVETPTSLTVFHAGDAVVLEVTTRLDPAANTALSGLYRSGGIFCTQCESEGFRRITWFPDRPDVMAPYRVRIEADQATCPVLLSNGNRMAAGKLPSGRYFAEWDDPFPKPSYLFALVAGDLDHLRDTFITTSGRKVDLFLYTEHGFADQGRFGLQALKRAMIWDEKAYGREYDLDVFHIVAVSDFNMGAMENKSLNLFNTAAVFATGEKTTDERFLWVEKVVAHEYFHNWSGNRVTCRDWFQLTLKEGLTVYRDSSFSRDLHSRSTVRIDEVSVLRNLQFAEDQGPGAHPIRPEEYEAVDNFYTKTVYDKGGHVIGMLHTFLGDKLFRAATDLYFGRHDGQAVTCEDFLICMEDASGLDLTNFRRWYSQAGTPTVRLTTDYDVVNQRLTLTLKQGFPTQPRNLPVPMPLRLGLLGSEGRELPLDAKGSTEVVLTFDQSEQSFVFDNLTTRPVVSPFRHFSAPIRLETDHTDADLAFLLAHDTDGFNRYEAGFTLKKKELLKRVAARKMGKVSAISQQLLGIFGGLLDDLSLAPDLKSRLLTLVPQSVLEQECDPVDPLLIHRTLTETRLEMARALEPRLRQAYQRHHRHTPLSEFPTDAEIADRALKNLALGLLAQLERSDVYDLASTQYHEATTMTDRLAALAVFRDTDRPERSELLEDFYQRFHNDKLVIDLWFSFQASTDLPDQVERMGQLEAHRDCDFANPNRVRALYRSFGRDNPAGFHRADGGGYRLLAAAVVRIDHLNPQVAADLVLPFQGWKRFAEPFRSGQEVVLRGLELRNDLSPNVRELVTRYLE